jgi:hypothetical protein
MTESLYIIDGHAHIYAAYEPNFCAFLRLNENFELNPEQVERIVVERSKSRHTCFVRRDQKE